MQQALASLESVEAQRPGSHKACGQDRRGRSHPGIVEESIRTGHVADGLLDILTLMPKATVHYVMNRFGHSGFREDCDLLVQMVKQLGEDAINQLLDVLQSSPPAEAAESIGILSQVAPEQVSRILPVRLSQWPRSTHDRTVRQLSAAPPEHRAALLVTLYDSLDLLIRPLAMDEMGMSGSHACILS